MKISNIKKWSTEKLSQSIFYVLVGFAVITFFLFFFVGYDMPFDIFPLSLMSGNIFICQGQ